MRETVHDCICDARPPAGSIARDSVAAFPSKRGGSLVGLFRKQKPLQMDFPGGARPELQTEAGRKAAFVWSIERRRVEGIPEEDRLSHQLALYAHSLGIPREEELIAWGPLEIEAGLSGKTYVGEAVVTQQSMLAWWTRKRSGLIHTFQGYHDALVSLVPVTSTLATYTYLAAIQASDGEPELVDNAVMRFGQHYGDDPHANRRSQELFYSWRRRLEEQP
ncbi:MAG: hypothetical protein QG597_4630 [Actinomycetota bacterium]|jgi:hypothetical protein|nr:hypothetical protein [Actinomycetota bacterium]